MGYIDALVGETNEKGNVPNHVGKLLKDWSSVLRRRVQRVRQAIPNLGNRNFCCKGSSLAQSIDRMSSTSVRHCSSSSGVVLHEAEQVCAVRQR